MVVRRLAVLVLTLATPLRAEESGQPTRFHSTLRAPEGCPTVSEFAAGISGRTQLAAPVATAAQADLVLFVTVTPGGKQLVGRLSLRWPDAGRTARREVAGASCGEVLDALAFVAALAIDPRAQATASDPNLEPETKAPEPATLPPAERTPADTPRSEGTALLTRPIVSPSTPASTSRWYGLLGVTAELGTASSGPAPLFGFRFGGGLGYQLSVVAVEGVVEGVRRRAQAEVEGSGQATLTLLAARVGPCIRAPLTGDLNLRGCAAAEIGALSAEASGVVRAQSALQSWIGLGASGGLTLSLAESVLLGLEAGLLLPTRRDRFVFEDRGGGQDVEVFRAPQLAGQGAFALQARFP